ncbi:hypothetical protein WJX81_006581 [Elliptochloris bilobata]|uniref:Spc7 kinetochore protein domain-containing protein n=1 Tax=Elliptochloris bilobata TaxID=381761 RepID=A0AAW1RRF0_9CHLO
MEQAAGSAQKRERAVLGELAGAPAQESLKKRKKAQKAQNRRVSFAPDNQLETMHLFLKDDFRHTPEGDRPLGPLDAAALGITAPGTGGDPGGATDDFDELARQEALSGVLMGERRAGEVTHGVPTLGELAEADAEEDAAAGATVRPAADAAGSGAGDALRRGPVPGTPGGATAAFPGAAGRAMAEVWMEGTLGAGMATPGSHAVGGTGALSTPGAHSVLSAGHTTGGLSLGYTAALEGGSHAAWGPAAEQTDAHSVHSAGHTTGGLSLGYTAALEGGAHAAWGPAAEQTTALSEAAGDGGGVAQISKWGLVPGADDTLDLNLSAQGRQLMGETTYNNIYGGAGDTNSDAEGPPEAPASPEAGGRSSEPDSQRVRPSGPSPLGSGQSGPWTRQAAGNRRRSTLGGDMTGRLLADEFEPEDQQALPAMEGSPLPEGDDVMAGHQAGPDATTGLLREAVDAPQGGPASAGGPLGMLRQRMTLLDAAQGSGDLGGQAHTAGLGLGRSDSSGPHTLALLRSGSTAPPFCGERAPGPGGDARPAGGTTRLLADVTMASAAGSLSAGVAAAAAASVLHGQGVQRPAQAATPAESPDLLRDQTMEDMEVPPELGACEGPPGGTPAAIPGGPLLQRTPPPASAQRRVDAASASLQRVVLYSTTRVPPSPAVAALRRSPAPARSQPRSQPCSALRISLGTGAAAAPAATPAAYPVPEGDTSTLQRIPGGPKIARTPVGGRAGDAGASPASGTVARREGLRSSDRAPAPVLLLTGDPRGRTPLAALPSPAPLTFQDFLKEADLQFLDAMRRGTSLNLADLASDPPPQTLQESYVLACVTRPAVEHLERSLKALQEAVAGRRADIAAKEAALAADNPPAFRALQRADAREAEQLKAAAAALKRLCRQRTAVVWKEWRASVEAEHLASLQANVSMLERDAVFAEANLQHLSAVSRAAAQLSSTELARLESQAAACQEEARAAERVAQLRAGLAAQEAANANRAVRSAASAAGLSTLQGQLADLGRRREAARQELAVKQAAASAVSRQPAAPDGSAETLLARLDELDIAASCSGWRLEGASSTAAGSELVLRSGPFVRTRLFVSAAAGDEAPHVRGYLEHTQPEEALEVPATERELAVALLRAAAPPQLPGSRPPSAAMEPTAILARLDLPAANASRISAVLLAYSAWTGRIAEAAAEAAGLRKACPALAAVAAEGAGLRLDFLNLAAELKFSVLLRVGDGFPLDAMTCQARIHLAPPGIALRPCDIEAAVAAARPGFGSLRSVCSALARLAAAAGSALRGTDVAAEASDASAADGGRGGGGALAVEAAGPLSLFSNPLFTQLTPGQRL